MQKSKMNDAILAQIKFNLRNWSLYVSAQRAGISVNAFYRYCKISPEWDEVRQTWKERKKLDRGKR